MGNRFEEIAERYRKDHNIHNSQGTDYKKLSSIGSDDSFLNILKTKIHEADPDPESSLNRLTGMSEIKQQIMSVKNQMEFFNRNGERYSPPNGYHMCFYGPPGTGKTTVARILAGYLYKYGVLSKPQVMEMDGNYLKNTIKQSGIKDCMGRIIARADGGMFFIDEAYLLSGDRVGYDITGSLITAMEDLKESIVIVFAGYRNEMRHYVSENPGMQSRIQYHLNFVPYNADELFEMFWKLCEGRFALNFDINLFKEQLGIECRRTDFANGRDVRGFFQKFIEFQADVCAENNGRDNEFTDEVLEKFINFRKSVFTRDYEIIDTENGDWILRPQ